MAVEKGDVVSGALYMKLMRDYQEYDARQKAYIADLLTEIEALKKCVTEISGASPNRLKLACYLRQIQGQEKTIVDLKRRVGDLQCKIVELTDEIKRLKQDGGHREGKEGLAEDAQ